MELFEYENYAKFACEIADKFNLLEDEFDDISIIAKYDEAKEIIRELLCLGYGIASIDIHDELWENYCDEYIISVSYCNKSPSVWCEKFKRETGYIDDSPSVAYVMDNCSSVIFKHIDSEETYEVCVGETENINSDKKVEDPLENSDFSISVKCNLDTDKALEMITDMEHRIMHMNDIFCEMDRFRRLFNW